MIALHDCQTQDDILAGADEFVVTETALAALPTDFYELREGIAEYLAVLHPQEAQ